jgi:uncharacterized protein (DUF885 family)
VVETPLTIRNVIGQLDTQLAQNPEQSPYAGPLATFPEAVPEAERARLRAEAEHALGRRFDLRDFHAQVLMTGALPMPVLERKIRDWIAARQRAA